MPLGQARAGQLLWRLHGRIEQVVADGLEAGAGDAGTLPFTFSPLVDVGSMRHPNLPVRLFVS
jgi:urease accessory protein UreF